MRRAMVASQLRTTAVNDARVVAAMSSVARERFVPAERAALAYVDTAVPVASGRSLNTPMATGRLLTEAGVQPGDKILLVGTATGYTAALLAELAKTVVALEADVDLSRAARANLADIANVTLVEGALAAGFAAQAPYDVILIDGAVEEVPTALVDQLADGGRLATGLVDGTVARLAIGRRAGTGFGLTAFADADSVILPGFEKARVFTF